MAVLLLLVFAFNATPKVVFHAVLADHKDGFVCQDTDKGTPHFHLPAFHCAFDDLVVSGPFLSVDLRETPAPPVFYTETAFRFVPDMLSMPFLHKESRGPPLT